jgi:hypothetical protein
MQGSFFRGPFRVRKKTTTLLGLCILGVAVNLTGQGAEPANVTFSLNFPTSDPEHYSISLDSDGRAKYECSARISEDSGEHETYQTEFHFSQGGRTRIFDLAAQSHYFSGKIDSGNHKIAFTGAKKLTYHDASRNNDAEYNYSTLAPVQQLTELFQRVAATMEFGRRLEHNRRYQKLALDDELKRMESQAQDNELAELQAIEPVLREVYEDTSVMNVVRARAQRLIEVGKKENLAPR